MVWRGDVVDTLWESEAEIDGKVKQTSDMMRAT
jgi:hypothetical protein